MRRYRRIRSGGARLAECIPVQRRSGGVVGSSGVHGETTRDGLRRPRGQRNTTAFRVDLEDATGRQAPNLPIRPHGYAVVNRVEVERSEVAHLVRCGIEYEQRYAGGATGPLVFGRIHHWRSTGDAENAPFHRDQIVEG